MSTKSGHVLRATTNEIEPTVPDVQQVGDENAVQSAVDLPPTTGFTNDLYE